MKINEVVNKKRLLIESLIDEILVPKITNLYKMIHRLSNRFKNPPEKIFTTAEILLFRLSIKGLLLEAGRDPRLKQSVRLLNQLNAYFAPHDN